MQLDLEVLKKIRLSDASVSSAFKTPEETWHLMFNMLRKNRLSLSGSGVSIPIPYDIQAVVSDIINSNSYYNDKAVTRIQITDDVWSYGSTLLSVCNFDSLTGIYGRRSTLGFRVYCTGEDGSEVRVGSTNVHGKSIEAHSKSQQSKELYAFIAFFLFAEKMQLLNTPSFANDVYRKNGRWFLKMLCHMDILYRLNQELDLRKQYDLQTIDQLEYVVDKEIEALKHVGQIVKLEMRANRRIFEDSDILHSDIYIATNGDLKLLVFEIDGILCSRTAVESLIDTELCKREDIKFIVQLLYGSYNSWGREMFSALRENALVPLQFVMMKNIRHLTTFIAEEASFDITSFSSMIYNLYHGLPEVPTATGVGSKGLHALRSIHGMFNTANELTNRLIKQFSDPLSSKELVSITDDDVKQFCEIHNIAAHPLIKSIAKKANSSNLLVVLKENMQPELIQMGGRMYRVDPGVMRDFSIRSFEISFDSNNRFSTVMGYRNESMITPSFHPNISSNGSVCLGDLTNETFVNFETFINMLRQVNLDSAYRKSPNDILTETVRRSGESVERDFREGRLHKIPGIYQINNRVV